MTSRKNLKKKQAFYMIVLGVVMGTLCLVRVGKQGKVKRSEPESENDHAARTDFYYHSVSRRAKFASQGEIYK